MKSPLHLHMNKYSLFFFYMNISFLLKRNKRNGGEVSIHLNFFKWNLNEGLNVNDVNQRHSSIDGYETSVLKSLKGIVPLLRSRPATKQ